ncbi:unnamed protein product [Penicillium discolor]
MPLPPTLRNKSSRNGCYFCEWSDPEHGHLEFHVRRERMVLDPNVPSHIKHEFWMINALPAGPRGVKHSTSLCTMPEDFEAGYGGAQAEAVTLTADHTPGKPSCITFCAGVWSVLQFQTKVWYQPTQKAAVVKNGNFLYNMIHNTPERLLAHQFTHGHTQFGAYRATDKAYGWGPIVALAKKDNAQTDVTQSLAVINADTFTYWINEILMAPQDDRR